MICFSKFCGDQKGWRGAIKNDPTFIGDVFGFVIFVETVL